MSVYSAPDFIFDFLKIEEKMINAEKERDKKKFSDAYAELIALNDICVGYFDRDVLHWHYEYERMKGALIFDE